ncbi:PocR ligand-binding domain-containing protein [Schaedlerella sp.]|uniref:PocR ligand-binding domain-containing protein n=1 Tax=Schaedlerella sp. TaxID=2676057 RepID=UPI0026062D94|nr:PocR ligand-binding domain-containing protein [uncultured Schaedlerella sp.]
MISTFNLRKLNDLLKDFYTLTQIRITVFNDTFRELTAYPEHIAPFCQIIRTSPEALNACLCCDKNACEQASRQHAPYTYCCHAGLTECIVPIYLGNIVIGYLFFGHVFSYPTHEEGWKSIRERCLPYGLDMDALRDALYQQPVISEEYISSASHIMRSVAAYLCMERMVSLHQKELPVQIDDYITSHYTENISVRTICDHFQIGRTLLYEISEQNYGIGIAEHIRNLRIEKAKILLAEHPELRISEIAVACGFDDYNYFITVFKRLVGKPPRQFRQNK